MPGGPVRREAPFYHPGLAGRMKFLGVSRKDFGRAPPPSDCIEFLMVFDESGDRIELTAPIDGRGLPPMLEFERPDGDSKVGPPARWHAQDGRATLRRPLTHHRHVDGVPFHPPSRTPPRPPDR